MKCWEIFIKLQKCLKKIYVFMMQKKKRFMNIFVKLRRKFLLGSIGLDEQLGQFIVAQEAQPRLQQAGIWLARWRLKILFNFFFW